MNARLSFTEAEWEELKRLSTGTCWSGNPATTPAAAKAIIDRGLARAAARAGRTVVRLDENRVLVA